MVMNAHRHFCEEASRDMHMDVKDANRHFRVVGPETRGLPRRAVESRSMRCRETVDRRSMKCRADVDQMSMKCRYDVDPLSMPC
jgi:hypothetical protein